MGALLLLLPLIACIEAGERNVQRFVKIDVSKINVKNSTDNVTLATTTTNAPVTEPSTTTSTTEATTVALTTKTNNATPTESTVGVENGTTSTSTTASTTVAPEDPFFPPLKTERSAKLIPKGYYCRCDLTINACDVNCCCDIDCNESILRTFDCDEEELHADEYHHDAGLQSCRVQGGLFCLIEPIHEEGDDSYYNPKRIAEVTRRAWKEVFPLQSSTASEDVRSDHYRVDDIVYFYNETSELVQSFGLPYSLIGEACQIELPVRFLRDRQDLCRRTADELGDFNRAFLRHQTTSRFFRTPKKSTVMEHYCTDDADCVNATVSFCSRTPDDSWNCTITSNATEATSIDDMVDDPGTICRQVEVTFVHNYTNVQAVQMELRCWPYSDGELLEETIWQRINIRFAVTGGRSRSNSTRAISGNIGYLIGKPLIVTHLELPPNGTNTNGESSPENPPNPMIAYFTNETRLPDTSFRLRIPISRKNRCVLTESDHRTVNFGVDSHHRCNYAHPEMFNQSTGSVQNYTRLCHELQAGLYSQLLHGVRRVSTESTGGEGFDKLNLYMSKYANPINRTADWFRVRSTNVILDAPPGSEPASGSDGNENYFTCNNMLINVDYRFYYAQVRVRDVRHQAIVQDAEIVFGPRVNLRFRLDEDIRVPIFVQVQFFDLTSSSAMAGQLNGSFLMAFCVVLVILNRLGVIEQ